MVVARVAIFVVHLPRILAGRRAKESAASHTMNIELFAMHLYNEVSSRAGGSKGNDTTRVINPSVRTDLPDPTRSCG